MTAEEFFAGLTGGQDDFRRATEALRATGHPFCLIGGLAVNHYVEPVVTLDAELFGVRLPVAALEHLVRGKLWALQDPERRASKKAKDEADLIRICESYPRLLALIPAGLIPRLDSLRHGTKS